MDRLPRPVIAFLLTSVGRDRSPAYLEVSTDGRLEGWGGHVDAYGLTGLERGRSAADQVIVLQGLLPIVGPEICLPCVRMGEGAPADVYLFRDAGTDWVLLLDASAFDRRRRPVQQTANDRELSDEPSALLSGVLRALDIAVLERATDGSLAPVSDTPPWLRVVLPGASRFVENFMIDAEALWRLDSDAASVRSGPWHEDGVMRAGEWWDATALRLQGRDLIVITRSFPVSAERQRLLQTGRERGLELAARTADLADATGRLEIEHAERVRAAAMTRLLARAVQSTQEMICVTDLDDRFTFVNRSFLEGYGYGEDDVIGRHLSLIGLSNTAGDVMAHVLRAAHAGGWNGELLSRRKDGSEFPIGLSTSQITDERGAAIGLLCVARDITERKEADLALHEIQDRLRQAQRMEAVGKLAGGIAHDFNNLLTVMTGYTEMALADLDKSHALFQNIDQIRQACDRATALTRQLLAFSRRQLLAPKILDVYDVVWRMGSMLRRLIGENIQLAITPASVPAWALADAGQLEQVILNLAVNARDAMPAGGRLVVAVSTRDLGEDEAGRFALPAGRYVVATVSDTGQGMDPATLSRAFEPFFTTKPSGQGTGLGLATAYGILRQSGGGIAAESVPGQGSVFALCLPSVDPAPVPAPDAAAVTPDAGGSERVLLVEDEASVRHLEGAILRRLGYDVLEAVSGEDAIQLLTSQAVPIHIMLSDIVMPGMGGRELAERVASLRPEMKVLLMSGYTDDRVLQCQIRDRTVAFLQKPFSPDALARKVREVLNAD